MLTQFVNSDSDAGAPASESLFSDRKHEEREDFALVVGTNMKQIPKFANSECFKKIIERSEEKYGSN